MDNFIENFHYNSIFCLTFEDLIFALEKEGYKISLDSNNLEDDFSIKVNLTKLEKMFILDESYLLQSMISNLDRYENRFPEDSDEIFEEIEDAIIKSVDIKKLNDLIPSIYYKTGEEYNITKKEILEYISKNNNCFIKPF